MSRTAGAFALCAALLAAAASAAAQSTARPRYADVMEAELRQMGLDVDCKSDSPVRYRCRVARPAGAGGGTEPSLHMVYSDESDTIYFYFERYLTVPSDHARAAIVLRRLMELNWELLIGKFEWNPRSGEVRLAATLNTDSNFDRRAFRSIIAALETIATRHTADLRDLVGS